MAKNLTSNAYEGGLTVDPSVVPGVPATVGAIYLRVGTTELWQKFGPLDTDWAIIAQPYGPTYGLGPTNRGILQPAFTVEIITIYARTSGSDVTGDGTLLNPYQTMQRAVRDVPAIIPPGDRYVVDISGVGGVQFVEVLPTDYELPAWKAPEVFSAQTADPSVPQNAAVSIEAAPQLVPLVPATDAIITPGQAAASSDPVTGLITLTVLPRASWAGNALKGKFLVDTDPLVAGNAVIYESDSTFLRYANSVLPTGTLQVMEPSAWLQVSSTASPAVHRGGLNANNVDSIAFNGLKVTTAGNFGLACTGNGFCTIQLCELQVPNFSSFNMLGNRVFAAWIYGPRTRFQGPSSLQRSLLDAVPAVNIFSFAQIHFRHVVADGCGVINAARSLFPEGGMFLVPSDLLFVENSLIRNGTSHGLQFNGGRARIFNTDIYANGIASVPVGDGFRCEAGPGYAELFNVRTTGTPNGGAGVRVTDGLYVKVNAATSGAAAGTQLRGATGEMIVGTGAPRTWADFVSGASGRPALNEFNLVAVAGVGGTFSDSGANPAYVTGTGSRLYQ